MPKIKILHIIKSLGRGGAEMLLPETLKLHNKHRFEFHYIYFLPWKTDMVKAIEQSGAKVTCFSAKDNLRLLLQHKDIISYCKQFNINLIHCHLPWAGFVGRWVHKRTGIPMIYTEHNMQERYHIATKVINKLTFNYQNLALGVSDDVTASICNNINPRIEVRTLLNGVNTESFIRKANFTIREKFGIPKDSIVLGNVAVFRFQKRIVEWLHVFEEVKKRNKNVFGIIVGAGQLEKEIKEEVENLELGKHIFFPGLQEEVKPYYEAIDIFMMTSSFEGLPVALLEAMSMECAIVTTDAGGIKEVIRNGEDGLVVDVEKWQELPHLCQELIDNPEKLMEMKMAARKRVVNSFSLKRMVDELEDFYGEIVTK